MGNTVFYGRALYYPYTSFSDSEWIKTAALYYDGIDRIVPEYYHPIKDCEIVYRLNEREHFVRNARPDGFTNEVAEGFLHFAEKELQNASARKNFMKKIKVTIPHEMKMSIHIDKMAPMLMQVLPELGLAAKSKITGEEQWFDFEPITGAMYMTFLANAMATEFNLPIVTDSPVFQPLIRNAQMGGLTDKGQALASMVITTAIPDNIKKIPVEKIIHFREKHQDERHLFYNEINKIVKDLEKVDNKSALEDCLHARKKDVFLAVQNLDRSFKGMKISTTTALLGLSIPAFASGLGAVIATAGVVTIAAGKLATQAIDYYKSKNGSPYSYVLSLKRLKAETLAEQLWKGKLTL
jgi:hypothetical protein